MTKFFDEIFDEILLYLKKREVTKFLDDRNLELYGIPLLKPGVHNVESVIF